MNRSSLAQIQWIKEGLIFCPKGDPEWMHSHATVPFADLVSADRYRVYFSSRDKENRSQIGALELSLSDPSQISNLTSEPLVRYGNPGTFDDSGAMMSWVTNHQGRKHLYYVGWNLGVTVPFRNAIGLAISDDGGKTFAKVSEGPVMDRDLQEPYFATNPCILVDNGLWRMWYLSCVRWEKEQGKFKHYYHIKYAESRDGISWKKTGVTCIDFQSEEEYAIARPCVLKDGSIYRIWYSTRGESYRIGYAESKDGLVWTRKDEEAGIDVSDSGWDSEMIEYAHVFDHAGKRYMLYNGNGYGQTGFGLAVARPV